MADSQGDDGSNRGTPVENPVFSEAQMQMFRGMMAQKAVPRAWPKLIKVLDIQTDTKIAVETVLDVLK
ncbi:MAG: hypothetical protein M1830_001411 [Pleopsidium flavum]|nr:MAG: hypothetical protein M1830_001411 [Pleopsidium flavum]